MLTVGVDARELQGRPTGTGRYLRNLLASWTRTTEDRFFVYSSGPFLQDPVLDHPRITKRAVGGGRDRGLVWQERRLPAAARRDSLDVFFAPAYACPLSLHVPRVTAVHDLSFVWHPQDFPLLDGVRRRLLVGASIRVSRRILACSAFTRREILSRHPDAAGRVLHVPLGADDDLPAAPQRDAARAHLVPGGGPLVLTVGAVLNRRRIPELLRAAALLAPRWPGLVVDVVGENRTHPRLDLERRVRQLGLERHVRLSGFVTDAALVERYAAADAAVFLSEYEGFGLPVLEAMARAVPVVVADRPALSEIAGPAAVRVDPRDVAEVARALDGLLRDPGLRAGKVAAGLTLAARASWADTAERTRRALAEAAARP